MLEFSNPDVFLAWDPRTCHHGTLIVLTGRTPNPVRELNSDDLAELKSSIMQVSHKTPIYCFHSAKGSQETLETFAVSRVCPE